MSRAWDQTAPIPDLHPITPPETFPALAPMETFAEERRLARALRTITPGPRRTSPLMAEGHKFGNGCRTVKPMNGFYPCRRSATGRTSYCRACMIAAMRERTARHREERSAVTTDRADVARMTALLADHERWEEVMLSAD